MAPVYATAKDIEDRWIGGQTFIDPLNQPVKDQVETLIKDAHTVLRSHVLDLDSQISTPEMWDLATMTIANAVIRVLNNPRGWLGTHAGEFGYYYSQSSQKAAGSVSFTANELESFGVVSAGPVMVQAVRMSSPYAIARADWRH